MSKLVLLFCDGSPSGVAANVMDYDIVVSEFELRSRYYVHFRANIFGKGINFIILSAKGWIVPV